MRRAVFGARLGRRALPGIALVVGLAVAMPGRADRDRHGGDHDRARQALARGEVVPLAVLLRRVQGALGGEVVEVEFERKHDRWIYEFRVIAPDGQVIDVDVDAATAEVLRREAR